MYRFPIEDDGIILHTRKRLQYWVNSRDSRGRILGAFNAHIARSAAAFKEVTNALSTEEGKRRATSKVGAELVAPEVLARFQELTYRLAEIYDLFRRLPAVANAEKGRSKNLKEYNKSIRAAARAASLISNKIKHNDSFLARIDNLYEHGFYAQGFALFSRGQNEDVSVDKDLHDLAHPGMSFNLALRDLACDLLHADIAGGRFCAGLGAGEHPSPDKELIEQLRIIARRDDFGLRFENVQMIRDMSEEDGDWVVKMRKRNLPNLGTKVQVIQVTSGDGYTKSFEFAG